MKRPLPTRPEERAPRWRGRRLLPAAAAGVLFIGAFGLGMATKSSSSPQTATSLASPVSIQASQVTVPALQRDVPTPALKPRRTPVNRHPASPATTPTAIAPAVSSPGLSSPPTAPPAPQTPPSRVIHGQSGGVVSSSGGGGSVVHGGN
ncbi:MAG TPA: hypothetical protein VMB27_25730 [Solirubrobacteraceae bacterium]|nr:hypothetical protein [Solirubrobacteraceae bacterium]